MTLALLAVILMPLPCKSTSYKIKNIILNHSATEAERQKRNCLKVRRKDVSRERISRPGYLHAGTPSPWTDPITFHIRIGIGYEQPRRTHIRRTRTVRCGMEEDF